MKQNGFGNRVKELRQSKGWSQQELADRCGCWQSAISAIEVERRGATLYMMVKLADQLGVTTDYLLTGRNG